MTINPQAEAIQRLLTMAKSASQRSPLVPKLTVDPTNPPVGMLWIREDEKNAYLKVDEQNTLLVASAQPTDGSGIAQRSIPGSSIQLNSLTSDEIGPGAVRTSEIGFGAVTGDKWAPTVDAETSLYLNSKVSTRPGLQVNVPFDHASDVLRVLRDGVQRMRIDETHVSIGADLPASAVSIQTESTNVALRVRGRGGPLLLESRTGAQLFAVDGSGNVTIAGSLISQSGNSETAGSLSVRGALTVTDQANFLAGQSVTGRADFRAEMDIDGRATFNAEPFFPDNYTAKFGTAVHVRTNVPTNPNRVIFEGVDTLGAAEVQFGTGGPVLSGSITQSDRMFIGSARIVTSLADGIRGNQIAFDTITGGNGAGVGNIASQTIQGYNIKDSSITSTKLSPGAVVRAAIDTGAVGPVQLADGSVIDRVVASMGVGKLISGTLNADEVFMGPSGHIYLGPTYASEITGERVQLDSSGIVAYNSFNSPLAEFKPGGFALRTGVDGARLSISATTGIELFNAAGQRSGYLSALGQFQLDSQIDGARMSLNSQEGVAFYAGATKNLAYNPGFIGGAEQELAVAGEAINDQRHVFAGEYAVRFRSTNPNVTAPSYVDVPFRNTVGTGSSVTRTRVNGCINPGLATVVTGWALSTALQYSAASSTTVLEDFEDTTYNITWSGGWARSNTSAQTGSWALRSGVTAHSGTSSATITVPANATNFRFWFRVSSETNYDFFRFFIDGVEQFTRSGDGAWTQSSLYTVSPGQVLEFRYTKDGSAVAFSDAAWVDNLVFTMTVAPVALPVAQTFARVSALGFIKNFAAQLTATAVGMGSFRGPSMAVSPGQQWALSCSARTSAAMNLRASAVWFDINGTVLSTSNSEPFQMYGNTVAQIGVVAVAPANAATVRLEVTAPSLQTTDTVQASDGLYEQVSGIEDFFDGDTIGYQWDGTPGNSTSSLVAVAVMDSLNNVLSIFVWSDNPAWVQIEGRDSTANLSRGLSTATRLIPNQWSRVSVMCAGKMDKVRLHYPSADPSRQTRITTFPVWWSGVQVEADKAVATPFCSGDEPGCRWEGVSGRSASIRDRDTVVTQISPTLGTTVSGAIVGGSLTSSSFFAGRIFGTEITGGRITGAIITGNQINGDQILAGTIQSQSVATRTLTAQNIAADTIEGVNIRGGTITGDKVAAGTITTTLLSAKSITADKMAADLVISQRFIAGSGTGARVEMHPALGLQAFDTDGVTRTFWLNSQTGALTLTGDFNSGFSGKRIRISTDGEIRVYPNTGVDYHRMYADGSNYYMVSYPSSEGDRGLIRLYPGGAILSFADSAFGTQAFVGVGGGFCQIRAPFIGMRVDTRFATQDGTDHRIFFLVTNNAGADLGRSVIHYRQTPGDGVNWFQAPVENSGIKLTGGGLSVTTGSPTVNGAVYATNVAAPSSETLKQNISEITLTSEGRSSWDIIEGAPSMEWEYLADGPNSLPEKPLDPDGSPVMLRQPNPELTTAEFDALQDNNENKWIHVEAEWPEEVKVQARRKRKFPLAEDMLAVDSSMLAWGNENSPGTDLYLSMGDMVGVLWDSVDMLIKRNRLLEEVLLARLPNLKLPSRPQKGDVVEGVGQVRAGRTRRQIGSDGQPRRKQRRT